MKNNKIDSLMDSLENGQTFFKNEIIKMDFPTPPIHIQQTNTPMMWEHGYTGYGIKVAVIDSGCDITNPMIKDKVTKYYNYTSDDEKDVSDDLGHGTHVTGLIAGENFENKVMGIAPDVELMIYKVIDKKTKVAPYETIAKAIYASAQYGANIINVSMGGTKPAPSVKEAIDFAKKLDAIVICANGNDGKGDEDKMDLLYPSCYPDAISVGAMDYKYKIPQFSNSNDYIDCIAFGEKVLSLDVQGAFHILSGSSQSTPIITGCIALLLQWGKEKYGRNLTYDEIRELLDKNLVRLEGISEKKQGKGYFRFSEKLIDN